MKILSLLIFFIPVLSFAYLVEEGGLGGTHSPAPLDCGQNASYNGSSCVCNTGYHFDDTMTCVADNSPTFTLGTVAVPQIQTSFNSPSPGQICVQGKCVSLSKNDMRQELINIQSSNPQIHIADTGASGSCSPFNGSNQFCYTTAVTTPTGGGGKSGNQQCQLNSLGQTICN